MGNRSGVDLIDEAKAKIREVDATDECLVGTDLQRPAGGRGKLRRRLQGARQRRAGRGLRVRWELGDERLQRAGEVGGRDAPEYGDTEGRPELASRVVHRGPGARAAGRNRLIPSPPPLQ